MQIHSTNNYPCSIKKNIRGWIIDMREDVGGNATAMLAAIGPLLSGQVPAKYITTKGTIDCKYNKGKATIDTTVIKVSKPFKVKNPELPIAVLTSRQTYGAAELIIVAFKNRPNVRYFGEPTAGATIKENRITLSDKAMLFFTSGIMCDTKGQRYTGRIVPDTKVRLIYTEDHCMGKAKYWLNGKL